MAQTTLSDLFQDVELITAAYREIQAQNPNILTSGVIAPHPVLQAGVNGGFNVGQITSYKDVSDTAVESVQVEGQASTPGKLETVEEKFIMLNREQSMEYTYFVDLALNPDPAGESLRELARKKAKARQKTLYSILKGTFLNASAVVATNVNDVTGAASADDRVFNLDNYFATIAKLGEAGATQSFGEGGIIWCHTKVMYDLQKFDSVDTVPTSQQLMFKRWRNNTVVVSDILTVAGSPVKYHTFFFTAGAVKYAERAVEVGGTTISSLNVDNKVDNGVVKVIERNRFAMHIPGISFIGTVGNDSPTPIAFSASNTPTDAELEIVTNWQYVYTSKTVCPVAALISL